MATWTENISYKRAISGGLEENFAWPGVVRSLVFAMVGMRCKMHGWVRTINQSHNTMHSRHQMERCHGKQNKHFENCAIKVSCVFRTDVLLFHCYQLHIKPAMQTWSEKNVATCSQSTSNVPCDFSPERRKMLAVFATVDTWSKTTNDSGDAHSRSIVHHCIIQRLLKYS